MTSAFLTSNTIVILVACLLVAHSTDGIKVTWNYPTCPLKMNLTSLNSPFQLIICDLNGLEMLTFTECSGSLVMKVQTVHFSQVWKACKVGKLSSHCMEQGLGNRQCTL